MSARHIAIALLAISSVAALGALFGPAEPRFGIDLGATGGAVFMFTLVAAIWLFSTRGDEVFPEYMSLAEKRAWLGLVFLAFILATFVREMLLLAGHAEVPESIRDLFAHRFIERYLLMVIAWGVISHLAGRRADIEADERDLLMRHHADRAGDWALTLIVIGGIVVLASFPREPLRWWLTPIVLANVLIGLLVMKSLAEHLALAYLYRRSLGRA